MAWEMSSFEASFVFHLQGTAALHTSLSMGRSPRNLSSSFAKLWTESSVFLMWWESNRQNVRPLAFEIMLYWGTVVVNAPQKNLLYRVDTVAPQNKDGTNSIPSIDWQISWNICKISKLQLYKYNHPFSCVLWTWPDKKYEFRMYMQITEGKLDSKLPTIWRVEKQMRNAVQSEVKRCTTAKVRTRKSWNAVFFQWFVCRVSRKVGLLKRRVRSHVVKGEIKNCTPLWREARLEVKMHKNTSGSKHFLCLRYRKIARRCGEKRIWQSKCTKHLMVGALFEGLMPQKLHAAVARSAFPSQNVNKLTVSEHFLKVSCRKIARRCGEKHAHNSQVKTLKNWRSRSTFWSSDV